MSGLSTRGLAGTALALALAWPVATAAQTQSRVSADASATIGYNNNPFQTVGSDTGAAVVTLDIAPSYQLLTPRSTITVSADANLQQYLSHYGHNDSYSGAFDYQGRPSEHVAAHARLDLSSAVLGAYNNYLPLATTPTYTAVPTPVAATGTAVAGTDAAALVPVTVVSPLVPYTDVGLYGLRTRRRTGRLSGDLGFTLSSRDSLTVAGYAEVTRYNDASIGAFGSGDYEAYGGSLGYQRRLSDRLSVGLTGSAASYNYHGGYPDNQIYSIQATASARFSDRWNASGALGVSFVNGGYGLSTTSTSLSGNINVCRTGPHSSMCVQASRQVSPTGFAGSQYVTSAGLFWNRQLDERQNVSLSGSYSKVGGDNVLGTAASPLAGYPLQTQYAQATAGYSRRLGTRLRLVASVDYRALLGDNVGRADDFGGQIGLSYHFGAR